MFNFSENNDFQNILQRMLDNVPDILDKRQGSIIYDALAPAAAELAQCYIALDVYADQSYLLQAVGDNLDNKVFDYGLERNKAIAAQRIGNFKDTNGNPMKIDIDSRWSIPNNYGGYNFIVIEELEIGKYILECETAGTVGNEYFGLLLPLDSTNNLGEATLNEIYIGGEDEEDDESLRTRAIDKINASAFGGNIDNYREFVNNIDGIGNCLVIPIWNGGGTVKLVIVTTSYNIPETGLINEVQTLVDPVENSGQGYGMAPIGHEVTVVGPKAYELSITGDITLEEGSTLEGLQSSIENAIKDYILEVQKDWFKEDEVRIYIARIISAILSVAGIINIENVKINGSEDNVVIKPIDNENPYPIFKEVIFNEN